jgi:glycosyltransferase involved in cell wall biosynthesis
LVTPSLNQGEFIEETIRSILLQGYPNLEYIVIDGGSNDGSIEIIKKYEPWLAFWVSEPDQGQADAINKGFGKSTGDIMGWLNSDDTFMSGAIAYVVQYFSFQPASGILSGEAWYIDECSCRLRPCRYDTEALNRRYILNIDPFVQPATFWRRSLWQTVGKLDTSLRWGFDWEFFIRAYLNTELHYIPEFLANYRLRDDMKTKIGGQARHAELARITRRYGGWWQPTNLLYQAARLQYLIRNLASDWPGWIREPLELTFSTPWYILGRLYAGKFMW